MAIDAGDLGQGRRWERAAGLFDVALPPRADAVRAELAALPGRSTEAP
ncbi:MAG TPA: hypothetical protein VI357_02190 [Mycobacteriales bacterium]